MGNLLKVISFKKEGNKTPLAYEFKVDGSSSPFLITNSKSLLWVDAPNDKVRAGVRIKCNIKEFFMEILEEIIVVGLEANWGNVQSFDPTGIKTALNYLKGYEVGSLEVLVNPESRSSLEGLEVKITNTHWLPKNFAVFVPQDRDFLGFIGMVGEDFVSVVHNPSRGISVARLV